MLPDTLVKLASFGTSGVCVLIVFWAGHTMTKFDSNTPQPVFRLFRLYLFVCVFIAIISALTGFAVARNSETNTKQLAGDLKQAEQSLVKVKDDAAAVNAKIQEATTGPQSSPKQLPITVLHELKKPAENVTKETEKSLQNIDKTKKWLRARTGIKW